MAVLIPTNIRLFESRTRGDLETQINTFLDTLAVSTLFTVTHTIALHGGKSYYVATIAFTPVEALNIQLFTADIGGGNLLDYTTTANDNLTLVFAQFTSASVNNVVDFVLFKDSVVFDRLHFTAGLFFHIPPDELYVNLTGGVFGFPLGVVPPDTRLTFFVSDGPCTMRLWWRNGPAQFT